MAQPIIPCGFVLLGKVSVPSLVAATALFGAVAAIPDRTRRVMLTLRGGGITYTTDGTVPVAGVTGIDLVAGTYEEFAGKAHLAGWQAIQFGGVTTAYIEFYGPE